MKIDLLKLTPEKRNALVEKFNTQTTTFELSVHKQTSGMGGLTCLEVYESCIDVYENGKLKDWSYGGTTVTKKSLEDFCKTYSK